MSGETTLPRPRLSQGTLLLASMLTIMAGATISPQLPAIQREFIAESIEGHSMIGTSKGLYRALIDDGGFVGPATEDRIATLGQRVVEYARIGPDSELVETYETVKAVIK